MSITPFSNLVQKSCESRLYGETDVNCSLAYAEMNWALAIIFRPMAPELTLFETDESDISQAVDFLMPLPKLDSRGTRVTIN